MSAELLNRLLHEDRGRILVISSCSKRKAKVVARAKELYMGRQHKLTAIGVYHLIDVGFDVEWWILSAQYGLIRHTQTIAPYDVTFSGRREKEIQDMGRRLGVPDTYRNITKLGFDVIYHLLGRDYIIALNLHTVSLPSKSLALFFGTKSMGPLLPAGSELIPTTDLREPQISIKGVAFCKFIGAS